MNKSSEYFLDMVGRFARGEKPMPCPAGASFEELKKLSAKHSLSGIVGYMVRMLPENERPSGELYKFFAGSYIGTMKTVANRVAAADACRVALCANRIPSIYMKGYVLKDYYPFPELRSFGDVDILIHEKDRAAATQIMTALGYDHLSDIIFVDGYRRGDSALEIHSQLFHNNFAGADFIKYFSTAWDNKLPFDDTGYAFTFNNEYHLIYLFVHLAKHAYHVGAGVRLFLDFDFYLKKHPDLDFEYLWSELDKISLTTFAKKVFCVCNRFFGTKIPPDCGSLSDEVYEEFSEFILAGGTFGFSNSERDAEDRLIRSNMKKGRSKFAVKFFSTMSLAFPPYSRMRHGYKFLDGHPYLLPIVWVMRVFTLFGSKKNKARARLKKVTRVDDSTIRHYELLSEIGLDD